jgi:5-oxoprolinase (ATP-hydrolysing) subunit A
MIDLNCDMGEGLLNDALIMPYISSANIACCYHAGNEQTIWKTIELAVQYNVAVGAHVSFFDKENFGRSEMTIPAEEVYELINQQLFILQEVASSFEVKLRHVKPHGALYNMSARDTLLAAVIARAVKDFDSSLILFGLSSSHSIHEAKKAGLQTASEVFADRTYQDDGSLTPRKMAGAMIERKEDAVKQVLQIVKEKTVTTITGKKVPVIADTICIHGDGPHAVEFAKAIHHTLKEQGIEIKAI